MNLNVVSLSFRIVQLGCFVFLMVLLQNMAYCGFSLWTFALLLWPAFMDILSARDGGQN